jgi:hypothetical protein
MQAASFGARITFGGLLPGNASRTRKRLLCRNCLRHRETTNYPESRERFNPIPAPRN